LVFQKSTENLTENQNPNKKEKPKNNTNNGWLNILENIIGDDIINQDKYSNLSLHSTLRFLTNKIKANLKK